MTFVLFESAGGAVRLVDLGLSASCNKDRDMKTRKGTVEYVAPEVVSGQYMKQKGLFYQVLVAVQGLRLQLQLAHAAPQETAAHTPARAIVPAPGDLAETPSTSGGDHAEPKREKSKDSMRTSFAKDDGKSYLERILASGYFSRLYTGAILLIALYMGLDTEAAIRDLVKHTKGQPVDQSFAWVTEVHSIP